MRDRELNPNKFKKIKIFELKDKHAITLYTFEK